MHSTLLIALLGSVYATLALTKTTSSQPGVTDELPTVAATATTMKTSVSAAAASSTYLPWAAFGDSWASGVTYSNFGKQNLDYDADDTNEKNRCLRIIDAYSVQLLQDTDIGWTKGRTPYLNFQACSGSDFNGIADQISRLPTKAESIAKFATITIGGNDAKFFDVVSACIYQQDDSHDYGAEYPDTSGDCYKAITNAQGVITSDGFKSSFLSAVQSISDHFKGDNNFRLFITGYAQFFNPTDPGCDKWSFSPFFLTTHDPKVTQGLRAAINGLVTSINTLYQNTLFAKKDPRMYFVPIDSQFQNLRFCEDGLNQRNQQLLSHFFTFDYNEHDSTKPALTCDPDTQGCTGNFTSYETDGLLTQSDGGSISRSFHPKAGGHTLIKNVLKQAIVHGFDG